MTNPLDDLNDYNETDESEEAIDTKLTEQTEDNNIYNGITDYDNFEIDPNEIQSYTIGVQRTFDMRTAYLKASTLIANTYNQNIFYFKLKDINYDTEFINGYSYNLKTNKIEEKEFNYPDIIDNDSAFLNSEAFNVFTKNHLIPYTYYSLGSKNTVYKNVSKIDSVSQYLLNYKRVDNINDLLKFLVRYTNIVIRPINSNSYIKTVYLTYLNDNTITINNSNSVFVKDLKKYLLENYFFNDERYLRTAILQEVVTTQYDNHPFNITFHYCRGFNSIWAFVASYPRFGLFSINITPGKFLLCDTRDFLINYFNDRDRGMNVYQQMKSLGFLTAMKIQDLYPDHLLNTLEITYVLDSDGNIHISDINSLPSTDWYHFEHAFESIQYDIWYCLKSHV